MSVFEVKYNDDFIQKGNDYLIDNPKAHLLIITGMDEHSSRYEGFAHELNEKGFSVSVLDHWGQGENAKSIEEQQQWPKGAWKMTQASLNKKVEELKKEGIPVYLMGHSMGSFAVQNYLINYPDTVHKAIIMASNGKNNKFLISIGNMMAKLLTTKKNWNKHAKFLESMSVGAYAKSIKDRESDLDWLSYDKENIKKLYEIRRKFGMPGKHPASLCLNKDGKNCHNCGGACQDGEFKKFPGYQYDFVGGDSKPAENNAASDAQLVAEITKQVMAPLGMK